MGPQGGVRGKEEKSIFCKRNAEVGRDNEVKVWDSGDEKTDLVIQVREHSVVGGEPGRIQ